MHFSFCSFPCLDYTTLTTSRSVFTLATGKLYRKYDESPRVCQQLQRSNASLYHLDDIEFGRRMAIEKELDQPDAPPQNVVFDESGHFLLYPSLFGVKGVLLFVYRCLFDCMCRLGCCDVLLIAFTA